MSGATRALALAAALTLPATGCATAVKHPAITAGIVGGAMGFGTCKLASDDLGSCLAVGGGAGLALGLIAAAALWLGGDGNTAPVEEQAQPLPEDGRPIHRHRRAPSTGDVPAATPDTPANAAPALETAPGTTPGTAPGTTTETPAAPAATQPPAPPR